MNCPKQKRGSFWLVFLDRVEQEGTGAGGGGMGLGGGWVEWEGGPKHGLVGMRVGSELPEVFGWVPGQGGVGRGGERGGGGSGAGEVGWTGRGVPSAELLMRLRGHARWFWPTEKRKFLVGVPGQCGARKGGSGGGGGVEPGGVGCSWSGAGRGGAGPKTEKRKFLVGFLDSVESEGKGAGGGREWGRGGWVEWEGGKVEPEGGGERGGGGSGAGGGGLGGVGPKRGAFGGTWWACALVLNRPKQKNRSLWLGFLDRVEQERRGAGGGGSSAGGGVGWVA